MKTQFLLFTLIGFLTANAQTTHNLDWRMGIGSNVDLTIDQGDTVIWTWRDNAPHNVVSDSGNSVESFDSGILSGTGQTFSYTFTVAGNNDYLCSIHGANSMSGTITVREVLGVEENQLTGISLYPNPTKTTLRLRLPRHMQSGQITVFEITGKQIYSGNYDSKPTMTIDIAQWSPGSYFLKVVSGSKKETKRFIKN